MQLSLGYFLGLGPPWTPHQLVGLAITLVVFYFYYKLESWMVKCSEILCPGELSVLLLEYVTIKRPLSMYVPKCTHRIRVLV